MNIHSLAMATKVKTGKGVQEAAGPATSRLVVNDKREAIMASALALFVERGFYGTAVPEIADGAKVAAGTIYRYFESKEALVNALYRQEKARFAEVVVERFPVGITTREQFRTMWMRMAKFSTDHQKSLVFLELHHHARYLDAGSLALEQRMTKLFTNVVTAAQARGELRSAPPRLLMAIILGAFIGVIRSSIEHEQPLDKADWKLAEQCVWEAIRS